MDVLAGRKTGGYIEGTISILGYPKNQSTSARISGYYVKTNPRKKYLDGASGSRWPVNRIEEEAYNSCELVANLSIIFTDEPKSGLDAIAAAIVMHAVRDTVDTGRTVAVPRVPKIRDEYNPATWMLEIIMPAIESEIVVDFADIYANFSL
ncbi:unnamed protein product [Fraxinus pennsylvanica]|uniref:Uncharacterized protein n=1 Tax=Fraxinus pennsylvanica TaxID=56036 RepID=A0AAD2A0B3_9LAMI|nr:unnamed protein product [Fraxinus pennsylvanica]